MSPNYITEEDISGRDTRVGDNQSCWVRAGKAVVYIRREEEATFVDIFRENEMGAEDEGLIQSICVF